MINVIDEIANLCSASFMNMTLRVLLLFLVLLMLLNYSFFTFSFLFSCFLGRTPAVVLLGCLNAVAQQCDYPPLTYRAVKGIS